MCFTMFSRFVISYSYTEVKYNANQQIPFNYFFDELIKRQQFRRRKKERRGSHIDAQNRIVPKTATPPPWQHSKTKERRKRGEREPQGEMHAKGQNNGINNWNLFSSPYLVSSDVPIRSERRITEFIFVRDFFPCPPVSYSAKKRIGTRADLPSRFDSFNSFALP